MTAAEIELCPEDQPDKPSAEIEICPPEPVTVDFEIEVCPDEEQEQPPDLPNPCDTAPALSISGTDAPIVGSDYDYSGGLGPYVWSFDGGEISSSGTITSINACGASNDPRWSTVTCTDACGQTASIEVRLPGGKWVQQGGDYESQATYCLSVVNKAYSPFTIIGRHKTYGKFAFQLKNTWGGSCGDCTWRPTFYVNLNATLSSPGGSPVGSPIPLCQVSAGSGSDIYVLQRGYFQTWVCI